MVFVKRAIFAVVLAAGALFAQTAFAQIHGTPASVTSFTGGRSGTHGVPSSVTSLGPRGYSVQGPCLGVQGCVNPAFNSRIDFRTGTVVQGQTFNLHGGRNGHRRGHGGQGVVVYYPYAYPYPVPVAVEPDDQYAQEQQEQQPEGPGLTVFDRRSNVQPAPNPTPYPQRVVEPRVEPSASGAPVSPVVEELIPVVIVFKDGHQQEIGNYAIVGDTIYDINNRVARKIKLADVDLPQTIQKNEDRGIDFAVPASLRPKA